MTNFCFSRLLRTFSNAGKTDSGWRWIAVFVVVNGLSINPVCAQSSQKEAATSTSTSKASCDSMAVKPIRRVTQPYAKKPSKNSVDWTTMASTYTHADQGQRVDQFSTGIEPVAIERPDFVRSGFRHTRSTLQAGSSVDHYHSVEQWGPNVRPYGEWRYPTRPFSVPYPAWGPQLPQVLGGGFPWGVVPFGNGANMGMGSGQAMPGMPGNPGMPWNPGMPVQPGWQPGLGVGPGNVLTPLQDDYYAPAPIYYPPANGLETP